MEILLGKSKSKEISNVLNLFETKPIKIVKPISKESKKIAKAEKPKHENVRKIKKPESEKVSEKKKERNIEKLKAPEAEEDRDPRTIFVGNVNLSVKKRKIINHFKKYGNIEKCWIRSLPVGFIKGKTKKDSIKQKLLNENVHTANYYILFSSQSVSNFLIKEAESSLVENGTEFEGTHLRVDKANNNEKFPTDRTLFVGNLSFNLETETLWKALSDYNIENIRLVRDKRTSASKGIAYIVCKDSQTAKSLLNEWNGSTLEGREVRISKCSAPNTGNAMQASNTNSGQGQFPSKNRLKMPYDESKRFTSVDGKRVPRNGFRNKPKKSLRMKAKKDQNIFNS